MAPLFIVIPSSHAIEPSPMWIAGPQVFEPLQMIHSAPSQLPELLYDTDGQFVPLLLLSSSSNPLMPLMLKSAWLPNVALFSTMKFAADGLPIGFEPVSRL